MNAREAMLARIRTAIGSEAPAPDFARDYRKVGTRPAGGVELVDLFEDRLLDYKATVLRATAIELPAVVAAAVSARVHGPASMIVPPGLDPAWSAACTVTIDDGLVTAAQLDGFDAVLTACAVAIAETGTIVLDGSPDQGRRAISLVPDLHLCVVRIGQIVDNVPDALRLLDPTRPLTFISGGSATSDIELQRVEGVHGPRQLVVLIVKP